MGRREESQYLLEYLLVPRRARICLPSLSTTTAHNDFRPRLIRAIVTSENWLKELREQSLSA